MRTKAKRRDLTIITGELRTALKRETTSIIEVGALLVEAKKQVMHGEWLPWLENEFSLSERSAQRYLLVGRFAAKYDSLSDLNLTAEALYALSSPHNYVTPEVITAVLEEAKEKRTRVEIGHMRIGSAGNGLIRSPGSGSSLSQRV
jgi:hypothetical protein